MAEHTPTPWKLCENMSSEICIGTDENDPWFIAEMCLGAGGGDILEPAAANASFIVKAVNRDHHFELLVNALKAIKQATINGDVCDDVAWFDQIETLHDFCDRILADVGGSR